MSKRFDEWNEIKKTAESNERMHYRVGMINKDDFEVIKRKLKTLLEVTP